jgi:ABC-type glycerol-3-phosphate transport system permease component
MTGAVLTPLPVIAARVCLQRCMVEGPKVGGVKS